MFGISFSCVRTGNVFPRGFYWLCGDGYRHFGILLCKLYFAVSLKQLTGCLIRLDMCVSVDRFVCACSLEYMLFIVLLQVLLVDGYNCSSASGGWL